MQMAWRVHKKGVIIGAGTEKTSEATLKCDNSKITKTMLAAQKWFLAKQHRYSNAYKKSFLSDKENGQNKQKYPSLTKISNHSQFFLLWKIQIGWDAPPPFAPPLDFLRGKRGLVGIIYLLQKQQLWPILTVACSNSWHLKILDHQLWIVPKPFRSSRKALHYWPRLTGHKEVTIRINYCTRQCFSELSFLLIWCLI